MTDTEAVDTTREGWTLLANYARIIAMLPLETWLEAINRAEAVGPIVDPTLWIKANGNMADVKRLIQAAMPLKRFVMSVQPKPGGAA